MPKRPHGNMFWSRRREGFIRVSPRQKIVRMPAYLYYYIEANNDREMVIAQMKARRRARMRGEVYRGGLSHIWKKVRKKR